MTTFLAAGNKYDFPPARQGFAFSARFRYHTGGTGISLSGRTLSFVVRTQAGADGDPLAEGVCTAVSPQTGDTLGAFDVLIPGDVMATIPAGTWEYECGLDPGESNGILLAKGRFTVEAGLG